MVQQVGAPQKNKSFAGGPLTLAGKVYAEGIGTRAPSRIEIKVNGNGVRFTATVGLDDSVVGEPCDCNKGKEGLLPRVGCVTFKLLGDNKNVIWQSPVMSCGDAPQAVDVSIKGFQTLTMITEGDPADPANQANWADAKVELHSNQYKIVTPNTVPIYQEEAIILTPKPGPAPRLTGAKIFGVRPGHPFLFTVTATGERPMSFSATGLPAGLILDSATGRITGNVKTEGEYAVTLKAQNALGETMRSFKIVCGPKVGLVPVMAWNSWNCFAVSVTAEKIKAITDAMVSSGLANHGWSYLNIDEGWNQHMKGDADPKRTGPGRDAEGNVLTNEYFPDMAGLVDYIHNKGLKAGIYTSPGPLACDGYMGAYEHEQADARSFAAWGFDYLKYDMCDYNKILAQRTKPGPTNSLTKPMEVTSPEYLAELQRPWRIMRSELDKLDRDIVFSISGNTRTWGKEIRANSWRTSSDIIDSWDEVVNGWEIPVSQIGFTQKNNSAYDKNHSNGPELSGPGSFNDFDMLVVGWVGWGKNLHPTRLTPNEQYTHVSLWCLLTSPLLLGCDLTKLDDFTLGLLTNDEVLEVNQDPLGKQAVRVAKDGDLEVWAKDMEDGSKAVGLFNRGYLATDVTVKWSDLGLSGKQRVRDLWRQKDLGDFGDAFSTKVPRHGVSLIRVWPAQ